MKHKEPWVFWLSIKKSYAYHWWYWRMNNALEITLGRIEITIGMPWINPDEFPNDHKKTNELNLNLPFAIYIGKKGESK